MSFKIMFLRFFDTPCVYHKNEKGKPYEMNLPLLKKRYHRNFEVLIFMEAVIKGFVVLITNLNLFIV